MSQPDRMNVPRRVRKWPFADLRIGQSFTVPDKDYPNAASSSYRFAKQWGVVLSWRWENGFKHRCTRLK